MPPSKGGSSSVPKMFGMFYVCAHSMKKATKFCTVMKLDARKIFADRPHPLPWPEFLVIQILMHDLFAVANLFFR